MTTISSLVVALTTACTSSGDPDAADGDGKADSSTPSILKPGQRVTLSFPGAEASDRVFELKVPSAGVTRVRLASYGDEELNERGQSLTISDSPTNFDDGGYSDTNNEVAMAQVEARSPGAKTWYVRVHSVVKLKSAWIEAAFVAADKVSAAANNGSEDTAQLIDPAINDQHIDLHGDLKEVAAGAPVLVEGSLDSASDVDVYRVDFTSGVDSIGLTVFDETTGASYEVKNNTWPNFGPIKVVPTTWDWDYDADRFQADVTSYYYAVRANGGTGKYKLMFERVNSDYSDPPF